MSVASTRSRALNALRCYSNYALSLLGLVRITHMPTFISVEPAAVCQLRCPECPVGQGKSKNNHHEPKGPKGSGERLMSLELWRRVLEQAAPYVHTVQFYFQGEPLLNSDLPQMIREAHEARLYTIVSTNAQALTPATAEALLAAGLSRIIVSMDGLTEATYQAYRIGGSLQKTQDALRSLRAAKERLKARTMIELQVLRLKSNEHEWQDFKRQYKSLGADRLVFKTAQLYDYAEGHPLMPSDPRYSRYRKGADGCYHRRPRSRYCMRVWSGVVVTTDGEVLPCCYDKSRAYAYGNIKESPLAELFRGPRALAFRQAVLQQTPSICQECWK